MEEHLQVQYQIKDKWFIADRGSEILAAQQKLERLFSDLMSLIHAWLPPPKFKMRLSFMPHHLP